MKAQLKQLMLPIYPHHTYTDTFKRWFGDWEKEPHKASAVRDEHGAPLVTFHGTRFPHHYNEFDTSGSPPTDDEGELLDSGSGADPSAFLGSHFAEEPHVASIFATGQGGVNWIKNRHIDKKEGSAGGRIYPVYLNIKKPKVYHSEDALHDDLFKQHLNDPVLDQIAEQHGNVEEFNKMYDEDEDFRKETNKHIVHNLADFFGDSQEYGSALSQQLADSLREQLRKNGHDGIKYKNDVEGGQSWIAFHPTQIKSAIANKGTFSPVDPHINKQRIREDLLQYAKQQGFLGKFRDFLFGLEPPPTRGVYDGPLHRGMQGTKFDEDGLSKSMAERSAIANALQIVGHNTRQENFGDLVHAYVQRIGHLVDKIPNHPLVKSYMDTAKHLTAPSIISGQEKDYHTVSPTQDPAGKQLLNVTIPLVKEILPLHKGELRQVMDNLRKQREGSKSLPMETPIEETEVSHNFEPPTLPTADDKTLPLSTMRGEKGVSGSRHSFIDGQLEAGVPHSDIRLNLQKGFMLTPRQASATFTRHRLKQAVKKLSRKGEELIRYAKFRFFPHIHEKAEKRLLEILHENHADDVLRKGNTKHIDLTPFIEDVKGEGVEGANEDAFNALKGTKVTMQPSPINQGKISLAHASQQVHKAKDSDGKPEFEKPLPNLTPVKKATAIAPGPKQVAFDPKNPPMPVMAGTNIPVGKESVSPISQHDPHDEHKLENSGLVVPHHLKEIINKDINLDDEHFQDVDLDPYLKEGIKGQWLSNADAKSLEGTKLRIGKTPDGRQVPTHIFPKDYDPKKTTIKKEVPVVHSNDMLDHPYTVAQAVSATAKRFGHHQDPFVTMGKALFPKKLTFQEGDPIIHSIDSEGQRHIYIPENGDLKRATKELTTFGHTIIGDRDLTEDEAYHMNNNKGQYPFTAQAPLDHYVHKAKALGILPDSRYSGQARTTLPKNAPKGGGPRRKL